MRQKQAELLWALMSSPDGLTVRQATDCRGLRGMRGNDTQTGNCLFGMLAMRWVRTTGSMPRVWHVTLAGAQAFHDAYEGAAQWQGMALAS